MSDDAETTIIDIDPQDEIKVTLPSGNYNAEIALIMTSKVPDDAEPNDFRMPGDFQVRVNYRVTEDGDFYGHILKPFPMNTAKGRNDEWIKWKERMGIPAGPWDTTNYVDIPVVLKIDKDKKGSNRVREVWLK